MKKKDVSFKDFLISNSLQITVQAVGVIVVILNIEFYIKLSSIIKNPMTKFISFLSKFSKTHFVSTFQTMFSCFKSRKKISYLTMQFRMITLRNNFKVFQSIISFISVFMMNKFVRSKKSTYFFLHYQTMFSDIFSTQVIRMIRIVNNCITSCINRFTTFPFRMFTAFWKFNTSNPFRSTRTGTKSAGILFSFSKFIKITFHSFKLYKTPQTFKNKVCNMRMEFIRGFNYFTNRYCHDLILAKGISYVN